MFSERIRKRLILGLVALVYSVVLQGLLIFGYLRTVKIESLEDFNRFFILMGGDFWGGGYIQFLTYLAFFWCLLEIKDQLKKLAHEKKTLDKKYLPVNRDILMANDIIEIYHKMSDLDPKKKTLLSDLIKKSCTKFRTNRSIGEMMDLVSIQVEINRERAESEQSNIRYLIWSIPSLGFIGTVVGISASLKYANSGEMEKITALLGVAFDTTLVALVLSVIIMWLFHYLQEETDYLHTGMKEYVMDNLINRIEF